MRAETCFDDLLRSFVGLNAGLESFGSRFWKGIRNREWAGIQSARFD